MDIDSTKTTNSAARLKLESLRHMCKAESRAFKNRNYQVRRILDYLGIQIISATGSLGLLLFLGFSYGLSPLFIFATFGVIAAWILKLKFKAIRISKAMKHSEPDLADGSLLARIKGDTCEFFLIERRSTFHFYLSPINYDQILYKKCESEPSTNSSSENKKTLLLHKKRVFENFYVVVNQVQTTTRIHQISA